MTYNQAAVAAPQIRAHVGIMFTGLGNLTAKMCETQQRLMPYVDQLRAQIPGNPQLELAITQYDLLTQVLGNLMAEIVEIMQIDNSLMITDPSQVAEQLDALKLELDIQDLLSSQN